MSDPSQDLKDICHQMAYGDDSKETFLKYCKLINFEATEEEIEEFRQETFYE